MVACAGYRCGPHFCIAPALCWRYFRSRLEQAGVPRGLRIDLLLLPGNVVPCSDFATLRSDSSHRGSAADLRHAALRLRDAVERRRDLARNQVSVGGVEERAGLGFTISDLRF